MEKKSTKSKWFIISFCQIFFWDTWKYLCKHFKKYWLLGIGGLIIFAFATYPIVSYGVVDFSRHILFGKFYDEYKKLDQIKIHYQLDSVIDLYWNPSIINHLSWDLIENLFINDAYILQAITDEEKKVIGLGIVCLNRKFNYKIWGITLCRSKINEVDKYGFWFAELNWSLSPQSMEYFESYWWDGVHGYKFYVYGFNSLWYLNNNNINYNFLDFNQRFKVDYATKKSMLQTDENLQNFRKNIVINTYFVSDSLPGVVMDLNDKVRFWPDYYQIHYLTETKLF